MSAHEFLAASSAPIWGFCPAAPQMAAVYPQEETDDTRAGNASHWYASEILKGKNPSVTVDPAGTILTDEMKDCALIFVQDVQDAMIECAMAAYTEFKVMARRIHQDHCGGTVDAFLYAPQQSLLIVWDYKFGHKPVSEYENRQLIVYTSGILDLLGINGHAEQSLTVEHRIVQPRSFVSAPVRRWKFAATDLRPLYNSLYDSAQEATALNPRAISGPHCYYCPARHACVASRNATMSALDYIGRGTPDPLTPEALAYELNILERAEDAIKGRLTGLQEQAKEMIRAGTVVPGWALQDGKGRLAWKSGMDIIALGKAYGIDLAKPDYITPTQAAKKGIDEFVINAYAERPSTGLKLVQQDTTVITRILKNGSK